MKATNVYTVKKVRDLESFDGISFSASLYRNGKAVAEVMGCPYGGTTNYLWLDKSGVEQSIFKQTVIDKCCDGVEPDDILCCLDIFMEDLVNDVVILKQFKRTSKNKVMYVQEDGGVFVLARSPTVAIIAAVMAKYPTCKVLNNLSDEEVLAVLRPLQPA